MRSFEITKNTFCCLHCTLGGLGISIGPPEEPSRKYIGAFFLFLFPDNLDTREPKTTVYTHFYDCNNLDLSFKIKY